MTMTDPSSAAHMARKTDLRLAEVDVNGLPSLWPVLGPLLEKACAYSGGGFTPVSVVDGMMGGAFRMLALADDEGPRAIMIVCLSTMPSGLKIFECLLVSGDDMKAWTPFEPLMDAYARAEGCQRVRLIGRKGLAKMLPHWRLAAHVLERDLESVEAQN